MAPRKIPPPPSSSKASSPKFPAPPALSRSFDRVARGEWAELAFMAKAASLGLVACRPPGNSRPFDFLVYVPGVHAVRVQVKSAWCRSSRKYVVKATRSHPGRPYRRSEVDIFVVYVVPENAWYVFPARAMTRFRAWWFFPHVQGTRSKFEKYREAWHLLTEERPRRGMRVDLQACAEETLRQAQGFGSGLPVGSAFDLASFTPAERLKFEKYRGAWHLLTEPKEERGMRVDLYACADEQWSVASGQKLQIPRYARDDNPG